MLKEIVEKIIEADGGYGDLGVIPTAPNPELKKKKKMIVDGEEVEETDKDIKEK